jgi:hypothetical protein
MVPRGHECEECNLGPVRIGLAPGGKPHGREHKPSRRSGRDRQLGHERSARRARHPDSRDTILAHLRAGHVRREIFEDYPTLPLDGIEAVIRWAEITYGPRWRDMPNKAVLSL